MTYRFEGREKLLCFDDFLPFPYGVPAPAVMRQSPCSIRSVLPSVGKRQKKQEREVVTCDTFELFTSERHQVRTVSYSDVYGKAIRYSLETYVFPYIGKISVTRWNLRDIFGVVRPLDEKGRHETASRVLSSTRFFATRLFLAK